MVILEGCTVSDSGLIFRQDCYNLEGDSTLIFTADEELKKKIAQSIWDAPMRRVHRVVDRVVTIMQKGMHHAVIDKNQFTG